jgi:integral membrane protein
MQRNLILLSFIEGASLLALLFIAMPMKYLAGDPTLVRYVGMGHGVLFLGLVGMIMYVAQEDRWPKSLIWFALITSSIPFGMFALERKLRARAP